jgi:hypothetical protein
MQIISLPRLWESIGNMSRTEMTFLVQAYRQRFLANVTNVFYIFRLITVEQKINFLVIQVLPLPAKW